MAQRSHSTAPNSRSRQAGPLQRTFQNLFRRFVVLGAGLLLAATFGPGVALAQDEMEDDDPFDRPGFYIGLGGSYQVNLFEDRIEDELNDALDPTDSFPDGKLDIDDSGGLNATAGYRVASFFAVELEYEWVDEYDFDASLGGASGTLYSIEGHSLTFNTKLIAPIWRTQPYFLLGGGVAVSDVDIDSTTQAILAGLGDGVDIDDGRTTRPAARIGVGIDLYITENILFNAEAGALVTTLNKPDVDDIEDLNYMSFQGSLQYRF